jgi:hypothetical protein
MTILATVSRQRLQGFSGSFLLGVAFSFSVTGGERAVLHDHFDIKSLVVSGPRSGDQAVAGGYLPAGLHKQL